MFSASRFIVVYSVLIMHSMPVASDPVYDFSGTMYKLIVAAPPERSQEPGESKDLALHSEAERESKPERVIYRNSELEKICLALVGHSNPDYNRIPKAAMHELANGNYVKAMSMYDEIGDADCSTVSISTPDSRPSAVYASNSSFAHLSLHKLEHNAEQWRHLVRHNKIPSTPWLDRADVFSRAAQKLRQAIAAGTVEPNSKPGQSTAVWPLSYVYSKRFVAAIGMEAARTISQHWNARSIKTPNRVKRGQSLNPGLDIEAIRTAFWTQGAVSIDDVLRPEAMQELQEHLLQETRYTRLRNSYMEAYPPTFQPRVMAYLAEELEAAFPDIFQITKLYRWWAFKQPDSEPGTGEVRSANGCPMVGNRTGVLMHADAAVVSLNLFATLDEARLEGGGLDVWRAMPNDHAAFDGYNKNNWEQEELKPIEQHPKVRIEYKYNRATLFMSDMYHQTEPFRFKPGFENQRINVAMLWGDGRKPRGTLFGLRPKEFADVKPIPAVQI